MLALAASPPGRLAGTTSASGGEGRGCGPVAPEHPAAAGRPCRATLAAAGARAARSGGGDDRGAVAAAVRSTRGARARSWAGPRAGAASTRLAGAASARSETARRSAVAAGNACGPTKVLEGVIGGRLRPPARAAAVPTSGWSRRVLEDAHCANSRCARSPRGTSRWLRHGAVRTTGGARSILVRLARTSEVLAPDEALGARLLNASALRRHQAFGSLTGRVGGVE